MNDKKYRLLDDGEIIFESDEVLDKNCEVWNTPIMYAAREPYNKVKMPPYRREITGEYDKARDYVYERFKLPKSNIVCELDRGINANGHIMVEVFKAGQDAEREQYKSMKKLIEIAKEISFEFEDDRDCNRKLFSELRDALREINYGEDL